jgi:hypothetical protein
MEEQQIFYCPYDVYIETMNEIWESKIKIIECLRIEDNLSDEEIDDLMM